MTDTHVSTCPFDHETCQNPACECGCHRHPSAAQLEAWSNEAEMGYTPGDEDRMDPIAAILLQTTDAQVWAYHFKQQFGDVCPDEYTMLTWFANAIETGRSYCQREHADG